MIGASSLSGDTLIACHFPVVQLPTWRLPVQAVCGGGAAKRPGRLCSAAGLTRAVSLPEQDALGREHASAAAAGRRHLFSSYCSLNEDRTEEEEEEEEEEDEEEEEEEEEGGGSSDTTSSSEKENFEARGGARSRNSFLPCSELEEEEEDEDSDGDNLHKYHEDSSFLLHGLSDWPGVATPLGDGEWGNEGTALGVHGGHEWLSNRRFQTEGRSPLRCSPTSNADSSCNSSDGVLVNFGAMYDRSNNPATPHDLGSPPLRPSRSYEGSVFLNLRPVQREDAEATPSAPCWSPRGLDSNCNSLEPPPGLSSLEASDLTACLQSQGALSVGTNQKYYKLVTCDLLSQSPSPAWSSVNGGLEGPGGASPFAPSEQILIQCRTDGQQRDERKEKANVFPSPCCAVGSQACDHQVASTSKRADDFQNPLSQCPCSLRPGRRSPHGRKKQHVSGVSVQPSVILNQDQSSEKKGAGRSPEDSVVRYSKSQRPTSLPIQPFVLAPADKPQAQHLGCLLEQYVNHKSAGKSGGSKDKGQRSSQSFSHLQPSPASTGRRPVFLEAASSSDTCSTCTPSPLYFGRRHTWSQGRPSPGASRDEPGSSQAGPNVTPAPNPHLVKIPTYQDLIHLVPDQRNQTCQHPPFTPTPPTLPLTTDKRHPNLQVSSSPAERRSPPRRRATPAAESAGFFPGGFGAALAPLSSLGSLFSLAGSGRQAQPTRDDRKAGQAHQSQTLIVSDKPPPEFCLSPDASYESLSISHLQRRGLLRSVSRAVDLIMAHFGTSRDPEEKMRLGNSSWSPTIAGLVMEHLCPTIQNILEDGLRDHKLDLIVGQRRNHSWTLVEISTTIGPSTRVLQSLVSKIKQCPELSSHCMRLRAFIMGLLNLRALEFWLSHLQSQISVITTYYHSWGFLSMSLGRCGALFDELLLLLQPLSVLPFDLNLLLEPRLFGGGRPRPEEQGAAAASPPPQPCSGLLATSWPLLQADRKADRSGTPPAGRHRPASLSSGGTQANGSPWLATIPEWWPSEQERDQEAEGVDQGEDCSQEHDDWSQISVDSGREERGGDGEGWSPDASARVQVPSPGPGPMRWAKLFGAAGSSGRAEAVSQSHTAAQTWRRPSHWLHLDRSQLGLLAQSIRSMKLVGAQLNKGKDY